MDHPAQLDQLAATLDWIERHLDDPLTVESIAAQAGLSPYHFSRLFSARMGRSVMAHLRGRRLVKAAQRLIDDPDVRLIDLALECGFESQESFTRAFRRLFGVAPGRFRQGFAVLPITGQYPMTMPDAVPVTVAQLPKLVSLPAFTVAGLSGRFDGATRAKIPQLWSQLIGTLPFPGQDPSWTSYGITWGVDRADGSFDYMAGVSVDAAASLPSGFVAKRLEAASYAVFRITLNGSALHPQVRTALAMIWGELVPASGLKVAYRPNFELYDGNFTPDRAGSVIDFYVPVEV